MKRLLQVTIVAIVVVVSAYVVCLSIGDARDILLPVSERLKGGSRLPIHNLAKELGEENWSSACIVLAYANAEIAENAPAVLRDQSWITDQDRAMLARRQNGGTLKDVAPEF